MKNDLGSLRKSYKKDYLSQSESNKNPFNLFHKWFQEADLNKKIDEANAFTLSTISIDGYPRGRVVLLKSYDSEGFIFYTNYKSSKGFDIKNNPNVCMSFFWPQDERQIIIKGSASKVANSVSDTYFDSRPLESRLGAMVSDQSNIIPDRKILDSNLLKLKEKYKDLDPKRPKNWGGYLIVPDSFEFWQGRPNRLHDRILYTQENNYWIKSRLSP